MKNRIFAASLAAIFGIGLLLAPIEAQARAGGFMAGRASIVHGGLLGPVQRLGGRPSIGIRPASAPALNISPATRVGRIIVAPHPHFRRFFGNGLPLAGVGVFYGAYVDQLADFGAYEQPVYFPTADKVGEVPRAGSQVMTERGVCRSETRIVPSEDGGKRPVTITRC